MKRIIATLLLATVVSGQGIRLEITGGEKAKYKIAVVMPLGDPPLAREVEEAVRRDLAITGIFDVLDPRGFLANLAAEGLSIRAADWLNVGAQGVVKARASRKGSDAELAARFFEVARPDSPALERTYRGGAGDIRRLAHEFANDLYKYLTGEDGVFTTRIAYVRPDRSASSIVAVDVDGGRAATLVSNGSHNVLPSWSPGGGSIAFTSLLWLNPDAYVMPIGGRARRFSKQRGLNLGPVFSPDGKYAAVTLSRDGNAELYLVRVEDGAIVRRLTESPAIDTSPSFSPDGSQIAFVSSRHGTPQIWVMSASGGNPRRLTFQGNYNQAPRWSPKKDVQQVAFTGRDENYKYDVFIVDVPTGKISRVTQGQGNNFEPTWAPSGRLIAFASSRGGLWVATADGRTQTQIVKGAAETPSWSPSLR